MLAFGILGCGMTWWNYLKTRASTADAEVVNLSPVEVRAKFSPAKLAKIEPGALAWVSLPAAEEAMEGVVVEKADTVLVRITDSRFSPPLGARCQVTLALEKSLRKPLP